MRLDMEAKRAKKDKKGKKEFCLFLPIFALFASLLPPKVSYQMRSLS